MVQALRPLVLRYEETVTTPIHKRLMGLAELLVTRYNLVELMRPMRLLQMLVEDLQLRKLHSRSIHILYRRLQRFQPNGQAQMRRKLM